MSLEKALELHTEALTANTDIHTKMFALLSKQAGGATPAEDDAPRSRRSRAEKEEEPEERPSRRRREEPEDAEETPRSRRTAEKEPEDKPAGRKGKAGKLKIADVRAAFANFLADQTKKEAATRRTFIEDILDFLKIDKTTDMDERDFAGAIKAVKEYDKGEDVKLEDCFDAED